MLKNLKKKDKFKHYKSKTRLAGNTGYIPILKDDLLTQTPN